MAEYIEGKRPVIEALRTGMPVKRVLLADNAKRDGLIEDILRKAKAADVEVQTVPRKRLDELSGLGERDSHQGVMAETRPFRYLSGAEALRAADEDAAAEGGNGAALIVVLDHITDAGNLGAIIRSAEVLGASVVVLPNKRSAFVTPATYKSSAGAVAHIPVAQVANLVQFLENAKKSGYWVAGASEHAKEPIWQSNLKGKMVLVLGNEGEGVSRIVQEACDLFVRIPQEGKVESLSVAQAASVCIYEWHRQNA